MISIEFKEAATLAKDGTQKIYLSLEGRYRRVRWINTNNKTASYLYNRGESTSMISKADGLKFYAAK